MDQETTDYIIKYFSELMTDHEKLALKHQMSSFKSEGNPQFRNIMIERGWISSDPEITRLLDNGYETFEQNMVTRIMTETPEKVFSTIVRNATSCPVLHMQNNADIADIAGII